MSFFLTEVGIINYYITSKNLPILIPSFNLELINDFEQPNKTPTPIPSFLSIHFTPFCSRTQLSISNMDFTATKTNYKQTTN